MYSVEERETIIRTDELMGKWIIDTTQRTFCTKLRKIKGVVIVKEESTENGTVLSGVYELPLNCVSFRNVREYSEEQVQSLKERGKQLAELRKVEV